MRCGNTQGEVNKIRTQCEMNIPYWLISNVLACLVAILLIAPVPEVQAADTPWEDDVYFPPKEITDSMKAWTVTFSQPVSSLNFRDGLVYINKNNSELVRTVPSFSADGKRLTLKPILPYEAGNSYILRVTPEITSASGKALGHNTIQSFTLRGSAEPADPVLRTAEEIQEMWDALKPAYKGPLFTEEPAATAPYRKGKLAGGVSMDALNMVNFIRYVAHLPLSAHIDAAYESAAQAAAVVNAANGGISHAPEPPAGMPGELYEEGYSGASTSNLGYGYSSVIDSIRRGYMSDADLSNRSRVGHRRWILSPHLSPIGFGFAYSANGRPSTAMKVFGDYPSIPPYTEIAWPAKGDMPASFVGANDPWSISLNPDIYDTSTVQNIRVTLTRKNDGRVWTFTQRGDGPDGYYNIDFGNYGYTPFTVIIQPTSTGGYRPGDVYELEITGLKAVNGMPSVYEQSTSFFELKE